MNKSVLCVPEFDEGLAVLAFKIQDRQFDLNRELRYVSMKDQILRGRTLIISAIKAELVKRSDEYDFDLIVIGGGIGGISAALAACENGLKVAVIEPSPKCFPVLGLGTDRLFSATLYDWPHKHFSSHSFPFIAPLRDNETIEKLVSPAILRFPGRPIQANALRNELVAQLSDFQKKYPDTLQIKTGWHISKMNDVSINSPACKVVAKVMDSEHTVHHLETQMIVFAMGFGITESRSLSKAANDFFSYSNLEQDKDIADQGKKLVRIVGAGDGGLQEALRFAFSKNYQDLHQVISALEKEFLKSDYLNEWNFVCAKLQSVEDHACRSIMWGYCDDLVYSELHSIYASAVNNLIRTQKHAVMCWARNVLDERHLQIEIVDTSTFSKRVYGLNRFLTLLLQGVAPYMPESTRLKRLEPSQATESPDVEINRLGFSLDGDRIGTAKEEDLLRRIAFRAIPMNLDAVI